MNRYAFRQFLAADSGATGTVTPPPVQIAKKKRVIKLTPANKAIVDLLKRYKGEKPLAELATMAQTRAGEQMKESSFRSAVSKINSAFDAAGLGKSFAKILPSDYNETGRGRKPMNDATVDDLAGMLGEELLVENESEGEGDESDKD